MLVLHHCKLSRSNMPFRYISLDYCTHHRAALTSSRQLRYEQAKHLDGSQSDSWILLKCFRSRVMAGSPTATVIAFLDSSEDKTSIVGCPDTYRFDPYCRTALGVQRDLHLGIIIEFTVTPSCLYSTCLFSG